MNHYGQEVMNQCEQLGQLSTSGAVRFQDGIHSLANPMWIDSRPDVVRQIAVARNNVEMLHDAIAELENVLSPFLFLVDTRNPCQQTKPAKENSPATEAGQSVREIGHSIIDARERILSIKSRLGWELYMTPEQFAYWLQGFAELNSKAPTQEQWQSIREHLAAVFQKVTPAVKEWQAGKPIFIDPNIDMSKLWVDEIRTRTDIYRPPPVITC